MKGMATSAGTGKNVELAHDKRRGETLLEQAPSTDRLSKKLPASQTHLETALVSAPRNFGAGWNLAEMQKNLRVLSFKQVPSLVRAGTLPLQSRGQEHTPKPRYSI
jgi:hypothetical protein